MVSAFSATSQPAVSKQLRIFKDADLVIMRAHVRQRISTLSSQRVSPTLYLDRQVRSFGLRPLTRWKSIYPKKARDLKRNECKSNDGTTTKMEQ
jgi:hypothetical protein